MEPLTLQQFKQMLSNDPTHLEVLDVRTKEEHHAKRISGAKNIPLDLLERAFKTSKNPKTIIVHCAHGFRAKKAAEYLEKSLNLSVYYLKGDIENWEDVGLPVLYGDEL